MSTPTTPTRRAALRPALLLLGALLWAGCAATTHPPITTMPHVDLPRFMGDWYVIANIPTTIEEGAHNAVESYRMDDDGSIATTFTFRKDAFDGPKREYHPRGFVTDTATNATWGMQFVWPFRGDYRIVYVDPGYNRTIIGRQKRDYVWIMARTPALSEADYKDLVEKVTAEGYDPAKIRLVPQRWAPGETR